MYFPKKQNVVPISILKIFFGLAVEMQQCFFEITMKSQVANAM
jgi:hypothetical protein